MLWYCVSVEVFFLDLESLFLLFELTHFEHFIDVLLEVAVYLLGDGFFGLLGF